MKKFENELDALVDHVHSMGDLTVQVVSLAVNALTDLEGSLQRIIKIEDQLDKLQVAIDQEAVRLLTVYGPVAGDLRTVLTVTHINTALERIGDQAVTLCDNLKLAAHRTEVATHPKINRLTELVQAMVRDALEAFRTRDVQLAKSTIMQDDLVDSLNDKVMKELLSDEVVREAIAGPTDLADALAQILIARSLKRMADQATNICEEVVYMVDGSDIRHRHDDTAASNKG